jgi:hypothetical protein
MIAESVPVVAADLAKQVELLQGSFDFWWWVWTLAISWLLLKTSSILVKMAMAPRSNCAAKASAVTELDLAGKLDHLSARLEAAERQIKDWKRIMPR